MGLKETNKLMLYYIEEEGPSSIMLAILMAMLLNMSMKMIDKKICNNKKRQKWA